MVQDIKTRACQETKKSGEKEKKETKEQPQEIFTQKSKFREDKFYCCLKPGHIFLDCLEVVSTQEYKWALKTATQHLCDDSKKSESKYLNKNPQSTKDEEDNISPSRSWKEGAVRGRWDILKTIQLLFKK